MKKIVLLLLVAHYYVCGVSKVNGNGAVNQQLNQPLKFIQNMLATRRVVVMIVTRRMNFTNAV